jgi:hypothetical protein
MHDIGDNQSHLAARRMGTTRLDLGAMRNAVSGRSTASADGAQSAVWESIMSGTLHRTHSLQPRAMARGGAGRGDLPGISEHGRFGNAINSVENVFALATARAGLDELAGLLVTPQRLPELLLAA